MPANQTLRHVERVRLSVGAFTSRAECILRSCRQGEDTGTKVKMMMKQ